MVPNFQIPLLLSEAFQLWKARVGTLQRTPFLSFGTCSPAGSGKEHARFQGFRITHPSNPQKTHQTALQEAKLVEAAQDRLLENVVAGINQDPSLSLTVDLL